MSDVVRVEVIVEHDLAETITDIVEIDRDKWDAMTPKERDEWCVEEAEEVRRNVCSTGYQVLDGVDINATAYDAHPGADERRLPLHRTEAAIPWGPCSTCEGGGCPDCTDLDIH